VNCAKDHGDQFFSSSTALVHSNKTLVYVVLCWKEIEKMLGQLAHLSTARQLLLISVRMLLVDLGVFSGELIDRLNKYIDLQNALLKQARADIE